MKRVARSVFLLLWLVTLSVVGSLSNYTNTYAVSNYDSLLNIADELMVSPNGGVGDSRNYSTDWLNEITDAYTYYCVANPATNWCLYRDGLETLKTSETGTYIVLVNGSTYSVFFTFDTSAYVDFYSAGTTEVLRITGNDWYMPGGIYDPGHTASTTNGTRADSAYGLWSGSTDLIVEGSSTQIFLNTIPITYPTDYEGAIIPETYETAPDLTDDASLYWKVRDKTLTLVNKTKIPPLDLTTMQCRYMVVDPDTTEALLDTFTNCKASNFQQVTVDEYKTYEVIFSINYDVNGDGIIFPDGEEIAEFQKQITIDGNDNEGMAGDDWFTAVNTPLEDCMSETFPYVLIEGCLGNLARVGNLLSFDTISFGEEWTASDDCHTLTPLASWIPVTNKTICPAFDATIRNTVTPFVTFLLGLTMIKFVTNKESF